MSAEWDAFLTLHRDLPREGPGEPADVAWAAKTLDLPRNARICDAACGPGGDIPALLDAAPEGHVTACDKIDHFVTEAQAAHGQHPRVTIRQQDMSTIKGPYDLIWCAGAVYFLGVTEASLTVWRDALSPRGAIAFSEPCWFSETPSDAARQTFADYPAMTDEPGIRARIKAAGYSCLATRRLSDAAWEAYFTPLDARIAALRPGADQALAAVLDGAETEAACWRREKAAFGYLLCLVRPT
jgi:trans-aconitate methyltransferase